jgi:hypothetical protein
MQEQELLVVSRKKYSIKIVVQGNIERMLLILATTIP